MPRALFYLIGALIYVLFPRDLVPDMLTGWGWLDDLIVVYLLWRAYRRRMQPRQDGQTAGQARQTADDGRPHEPGASGRNPWDPYAVLELEPGAAQAEIKAAYRRLAAQYHPDKVQHLGRDIQALADRRFKEIQRAYEELARR